jgi:uncharacterized protein YjbJ (UPF0337 family)
MGWLDKILGRAKQTAGTATDSPSLEREGAHQEAAAAAEERAEQHEDIAQEAREQAAEEKAREEQP